MTEPIETRGQALDFLNSRINYERKSGGNYSAGCFKLDRMRRLLELLGDPHERLPAVHIAGTKGKGSTAVMAAEMLSAAGYRTGLFTSPHVRDFEERMRVDGAGPNETELVELTNAVAAAITAMDPSGAGMQPTYFEIATAMAWLYFIRRRAEVVVLEVGLGGRLDATNLCRPEVTLITSISYDHTAVLGSTLARIAGEKAGIVKPGVPVISGVVAEEARAVVRDVCRSRNAPLYELGEEIHVQERTIVAGGQAGGPHHNAAAAGGLHPGDGGPRRRGQLVCVSTPWRSWPQVELPLAGEHQAQNAALALACVDWLNERGRPIPPEAARRGLCRVVSPVRIEVLGERPTVVVDAAHNVASARALARTLEEEFAARRRVLVFAATRDKDFGGILEELESLFETVVLTQYMDNPRGVPVERLADVLLRRCGREGLWAADPQEAWETALALAMPDDLICVTGSFFLAAEAREIICGAPPAVAAIDGETADVARRSHERQPVGFGEARSGSAHL